MKLKQRIIIGHLLFWLFELIRCYFDDDYEYPLMQSSMWVIFNIIIFYLNYFILIPHLLNLQKAYSFLLWGICFYIVYTILLITYVVIDKSTIAILNSSDINSFSMSTQIRLINWNIFSWSAHLIVYQGAISTLSRLVYDWYVNLKENQQLAVKKTNALIQHIRSSINTPFLLNQLNYIKKEAEKDPEKAKKPILLLSDILRYSLYETNQPFTFIEKEVAILNEYIELTNASQNLYSLELKTQIKGVKTPPNLLIKALDHWIRLNDDALKGKQIIELHENNGKIEFFIPLLNVNITESFKKELVSGLYTNFKIDIISTQKEFLILVIQSI